MLWKETVLGGKKITLVQNEMIVIAKDIFD